MNKDTSSPEETQAAIPMDVTALLALAARHTRTGMEIWSMSEWTAMQSVAASNIALPTGVQKLTLAAGSDEGVPDTEPQGPMTQRELLTAKSNHERAAAVAEITEAWNHLGRVITMWEQAGLIKISTPAAGASGGSGSASRLV